MEITQCYTSAMSRTEDKLEALFAKVRTLSRERKELAVVALSEIAGDETYQLSDDERAVLEPELEAAKRGEFASDEDVDEVLNKPWSCSFAGGHALSVTFAISAATSPLTARLRLQIACVNISARPNRLRTSPLVGVVSSNPARRYRDPSHSPHRAQGSRRFGPIDDGPHGLRAERD